ncbi:piRNA biogenesis protein EXD1-like isoform X2 [Asterias rubens]|uniref:piRNA biogenesis protein EXD1-like isoform X2 n=1 Tax=Asterias rubens TaxID=7604 RepID=UPI0014552F47|nr:piRNA biogenesis protein EXD1-like isoform X2 [Asterias rubens]
MLNFARFVHIVGFPRHVATYATPVELSDNVPAGNKSIKYHSRIWSSNFFRGQESKGEELGGKKDESSATKKLKIASTSEGLSYEVVDEEEQIEPALEKLRKGLPLLAVDLEGEKLNRKGELAIVSVATENDTFLFDIKTLGSKVFDKGLMDLLQDPDRQKLMFDCRQDSDCLWHKYNVKLTNVLDLQLMEVIHRGDASTHQQLNLRTNKRVLDVPRVLGFQKCLEDYVKDEDLIKAKKGLESHSDGVWLTRPLRKSFLRYAAADVIGMLRLFKVLSETGNVLNLLRDVSNRYVDFYRLKEDRSYDNYEGNPFLPWRIFQSYYSTEVKCVGCKRLFPSADFTTTQKREGVQKCPVCRKVKNVKDVQKSREYNWNREFECDEYYEDPLF